ncbi:MAG TPA: muconolactone Delta-isomerase family protein [Mycobacteriales bacterium]|nr:muconolactone Delta-isomerase family protein [Mycobacteriales bacterium]
MQTQRFLVRIQVNLPPGTDPATRRSLLDAERSRGAELVRAGTIHEIWRVPGTFGNVGIWQAADATALHEALSSLPLFPYMAIETLALADHPLAPVLAEVGR